MFVVRLYEETVIVGSPRLAIIRDDRDKGATELQACTALGQKVAYSGVDFRRLYRSALAQRGNQTFSYSASNKAANN
jgi:hypothetical protein